MGKILKKFKICNNEHGMALLITVTVISLLISVTIQFNRAMRQSLASSTSLSDHTQLNAMARSGITLGRAVLEKDGEDNKFDSSIEPWAFLGEDKLRNLFSSGSLNIKITDLSGKFQINSLVKKSTDPKNKEDTVNKETEAVLMTLLQQDKIGLKEEQAREIVDSLIDWLDSNDQELDNGAENSYYKSLESPYSCKNGPVNFVEDLLLVKGISNSLFYGSKNKTPLKELLTAQGDDGKININTAPALLLQSLHEDISEEMVEKMVAFREDEQNEEALATITWYKNIIPGDVAISDKIITTSSTFFNIESQAEIDYLQKKISGIIQRNKGKTTLLSWAME